ncbi:MAG: flavodoxin family protein [Desulfovibrionaceae bacterium]|nr:flavodoxin family protein [Desulfovibrionaceae bacterium]
MNIFAVNGSARKKGNTATILQHALDGAQKAGGASVQTEMLHLYSYHYTGCKSCFACKLKDGKSYGVCALKDELSPVLAKLSQADGIIFGSPIYFGGVSGMMRCFEERLLFPFLTYTEGHASIAPKKIPTAFFYTMNVTKEIMEEWKYPARLKMMEGYIGHIFGSEPEILYVNNTVQFKDYSKYVCTMFSEEEKIKHRDLHFANSCKQAEAIGAALVTSKQ